MTLAPTCHFPDAPKFVIPACFKRESINIEIPIHELRHYKLFLLACQSDSSIVISAKLSSAISGLTSIGFPSQPVQFDFYSLILVAELSRFILLHYKTFFIRKILLVHWAVALLVAALCRLCYITPQLMLIKRLSFLLLSRHVEYKAIS